MRPTYSASTSLLNSSIVVNKNESDENTTVMKDEKKHTYHDDNQETTPGHELEVDEGEHEGDDEDDNIEGLKKENINENEDSLEKPVENVTKLLQDRHGLRNIKEKNTCTTTFTEKPVKNVTILLQSRHGLRNTQLMNTNTYYDFKQEATPEDELEVNEGVHEGDDGSDIIEGLKEENIDQKEDSMEKRVENVTKLLLCQRGLRVTQEINTNTYENL